MRLQGSLLSLNYYEKTSPMYKADGWAMTKEQWGIGNGEWRWSKPGQTGANRGLCAHFDRPQREGDTKSRDGWNYLNENENVTDDHQQLARHVRRLEWLPSCQVEWLGRFKVGWISCGGDAIRLITCSLAPDRAKRMQR